MKQQNKLLIILLILSLVFIAGCTSYSQCKRDCALQKKSEKCENKGYDVSEELKCFFVDDTNIEKACYEECKP